MKVRPLNSTTAFAISAAGSMTVTLLSASVIPEEVIVAWATRIILIILCMPIVVMAVGVACIMPPEVILILALIAALIWSVPLPWVPMAGSLLAVGYVLLLIRGGNRSRRQPIPFMIYEFGADRIVPYYAWLSSLRIGPISGALLGMIVGIGILWAKTV